MLKKNRILALIVVLAMCSMLFTGCGSSKAANAAVDRLSVVCTIFPEYDWAKEIIGELGNDYELTLLMDDGTDLHNYQPTAQDIAKIAGCDVFAYVGGESDGWVEDALKEAANPDMQVINLLEVLGTNVKEEELVEGMEAEHEEEESDESGDHEEDEIEYDEHVWLSLKNTRMIVSAMEQALEKADSANAAVYQKNADEYSKKLDELDKEYEEAVNNASKKTLLFGDRFPFRYLFDDYGLDYYAAFAGCSAETEASFDTITFLAGKVDELGLDKVLVIEKSDQKIARTIVDNTSTKNQEILVLDSLQSVTAKDMENGETYLGIMKKNLEVLKQAVQ